MNFEIFFFDYNRFLQENGEFLLQADEGNYLPMVERARSLVESIHPDDWILNDLGCHLSQLERFEKWPATFGGFSLLVLLSEYLHPTNMRYHSYESISRLRSICDHLGWNNATIQMFRLGNKIESLLKPSIEFPDERINQTATWLDPRNYWLAVHPERSLNDGWFSLENIQFYYDLLVQSEDKYRQIDFDALDLSPTHKLSFRNSPTHAQWVGFLSDVLRLFENALEKRVGLYWIVAL